MWRTEINAMNNELLLLSVKRVYFFRVKEFKKILSYKFKERHYYKIMCENRSSKY